MPAVKVKEGIYWVGAIDWNLREFHGYETDRGTTYNAYLVLDEKVVLFDTVKAEFYPILMDNISQVIDPRKIDYIVVNHVEMDHSGALPRVVEVVRPQKVICSTKGKDNLLLHFHRQDWPYHVVKTGDEISIGRRTIRFIETRMLHWPDSMFSYLVEDRVLISQDGFGQHYATAQRFDDEVDQVELMRQAAKYYANILLPYSQLVQKLLADVKALGLEIDLIAPDHGVIWRDPQRIMEAYARWSAQERGHKVVIAYDTMWHSTERLAYAIGEGIQEEGLPYIPMGLGSTHRSEVVTELLDAGALVVGSPTFNNGILPTVADLLSYIKGLRPKGLKGAAFGSYGWSGEAVRLMEKELEAMGVRVVEEGLKVQFVPGEGDLKAAREFGRRIARAVKGA